ncbi:hypothetical protein GF357_02655 [Candidatus Dojkabacteria bacterium]|nr:hypothetical protein [Candidatus Dojkabacteria bacterium]
MKIKDKEIWCKLNKHEIKQSWHWRKYLKKVVSKVWRLGFYLEDELSCITYVSKILKGRKTYLELKDGPVFKDFSPWKQNINDTLRNLESVPGKESEILKLLSKKAQFELDWNDRKKLIDELVNYVKALAIREKADFIRFVPQIESGLGVKKLLLDHGFIDSGLYVDKNMTKLIYLRQTQKKILQQANGIFSQIAGTTARVRQSSTGFKVYCDLDPVKEFLKTLKKKEHQLLKSLMPAFKGLLEEGKISVYGSDDLGDKFSPVVVGIENATAKILYPKNYYRFKLNPESFENSVLLLWNIIRDLKKRRIKYLDLGNLYQKNKVMKRKSGAKGIEVKSSEVERKRIRITMGDLKSLIGGTTRELVNPMDLPISRSYWLKRLFTFIKWIIFG